MDSFDFESQEQAPAGPSEPPPPAMRSTPPADAKSFFQPYGLLSTIILVSVSGLLIYQSIEAIRQHGWPAGIFLPLWGFLFILGVMFFVRPPRLIEWPGTIQAFGAVNFETPADNVETIYYDGRGPRMRFRNLDRVIARKSLLEHYRKEEAKSGTHYAMPGLTVGQVDEIRSILAIEAPGPDTAAGRIEAYNRALLERVPTPVATYALIASIVIAFVIFALRGLSPLSPTRQQLIEAGANFGPLTTNGEGWRLASNLFIHLGFLHLIANVATLHYLGTRAERSYGPARYLLIYFLAGIFGSLVSLYLQPDLVSAGASGCIFGIMGAIFAHLMACRNSMPNEVYQSERRSGVSFLIMNFFLGWSLAGIDLAAHFGGLLFGFVFALVCGPLPKAASPFNAARPLVAVGIAVIGLVVAFTALPKVPAEIAEFVAALDSFPEGEAKLLREYEAIRLKMIAPNMGNQELADEIDGKLVQPWREMRRGFGDFQQVPEMYKHLAPPLKAYLLARELAWEDLAKAIRTDDLGLYQKANAEAHRANDLSRELATVKPR